MLQRGTASMRAFAGRHHPSLPNDRVVSFTPAALLNEIRARARRPHGADIYREYLRVGTWFDRRVAEHLAQNPLPPGPNAFFSFTTGCLETLRMLRDRGVMTVVNQIDGARVEYDIDQAEAVKRPYWSVEPAEIPDAYFDRLAAEWDAADAVIANSAWSAETLVRQGVPREKVHVVPLAYDPESEALEFGRLRPFRSKDEPLVVLWLGNVVRRKGIQYLVEAARQLAGRPIKFVVVGPINIAPAAVVSAPPNMEFVGRVTRDRTSAAYRAADLFVLPTLSDGFAVTQLEAMSHGLPVIATDRCGEVVDHGLDGLVIPAGDADALAAAIADLADDRDRLADMGRRAVEKVGQFSLAALVRRLDAIAAGRIGSRVR
jgi:glycosyltransferase involved in cell wall biosynthesis